MQGITNKIKISKGELPAPLVFKNARVVNVFTNEIIEADVAVSDGIIVAVGNYTGTKEIDLKGKYLCPSLIDGHVHIESSMVSPAQFAKAVIPHGVTTVVADPHEIANVKGTDGIDYMLNATAELPLRVYLMVPSCVPATGFETSGAVLGAEELSKYLNEERVLGLGEMMNFPGVVNCDPGVIAKLEAFKDKYIDGHGPMITDSDLNAYITAGIMTEHECSTAQELIERIRLGMYVQLREGSGAKNVKALLEGINKDNLRRCFFCTDDRHPHSLLSEGSIDNNIRIAIAEGFDPIDAIKLATLNPAEAYGLKRRGAVAPGYHADLLVLDSLEDFSINSVYIGGVLAAMGSEMVLEVDEVDINRVGNSVNIAEMAVSDLELKPLNDSFIAIVAEPESLITTRKDYPAKGAELFGYEYGLSKLAVIERHHGTGNVGVAAIEGFGELRGAIALTVAHDSHNLIVVGSNDEDIIMASQEMVRLKGGIVLIRDGKVLGELPLQIAGLMSSDDLVRVERKVHELMEIAWVVMGVDHRIDPFMLLSFMALPVIPSLKLTDMGLFDVDAFKFVYGGIDGR